MTTPVIVVEKVSFFRGSRPVLRDISLEIPAGAIAAIMGPSGCGKTTLLKLIAGLLTPDTGTIFVFGQNIATLSRSALYALRKRMGMLFQSGALLNDMTVFDNVALPIREHTDLPEDMIRTLVLLKLNAVGLRGNAWDYPHALSGGMRRRAACARAIALDPSMVLYDEPFAGQDPITLSVLLRLVRTLSDTVPITSLLVSHDVQETFSIADTACVLFDGHVIAADTPKALRASTDSRVRQFVQGLSDGPIPFHQPAPAFLDMLDDRV